MLPQISLVRTLYGSVESFCKGLGDYVEELRTYKFSQCSFSHIEFLGFTCRSFPIRRGSRFSAA